TVLGLVCAQILACVPDDPSTRRKPEPVRPNIDVPPRPVPPFTGNRSVVRPPAAPSAVSAPAASGSAQQPSGPEHDPLLTAPFTDRFDRATLGPDWTSTGAAWQIVGGRLCVEHARNHGVWLRRRLPTNAQIEFDAVSSSPEGDLKA